MYELKKEHFNKAGFISKEHQKWLSPFDQVLCYIKNFDKSHGYNYCLSIGQVRSRLVSNFYRLHSKNSELPNMEKQMDYIFCNFKDFKIWINECHQNQTLDKFC